MSPKKTRFFFQNDSYCKKKSPLVLKAWLLKLDGINKYKVVCQEWSTCLVMLKNDMLS